MQPQFNDEGAVPMGVPGALVLLPLALAALQVELSLYPLLLIPAILRLVKRVLQQINDLGVCFCFFLLTASQSITHELRETERVDQRNKHNDCQSSVPAAPI